MQCLIPQLKYIRWQRDSNGYPPIFGVQDHSGTSMDTLRRRVTRKSNIAAINRKHICYNVNLSLYKIINFIPSATFMFAVSSKDSNTVGTACMIISDVGMTEESKMAAI